MTAYKTLLLLILVGSMFGCESLPDLGEMGRTIKENAGLEVDTSTTVGKDRESAEQAGATDAAQASAASQASEAGAPGGAQGEARGGRPRMAVTNRTSPETSGPTDQATPSAAATSSGGAPTGPVNRLEDLDLSGTQESGWSDAEKGWMVHMRTKDGMEMIMEVIRSEERAILMETVTRMGGDELSRAQMWMPRYFPKGEELDPEREQQVETRTIELADETLDIGGRSVTCKKVKSITRFQNETTTTVGWTSEEVPGWAVRTEWAQEGQPLELVSEVIAFRK